MLKQEIISLFEKLDIIELDAISALFPYQTKSTKDMLIKASQQIHRKKYLALSDSDREDYGTILRHYTPTEKLIFNKLDPFTNTELDIIAELLAHKVKCLSESKRNNTEELTQCLFYVDALKQEYAKRKEQTETNTRSTKLF